MQMLLNKMLSELTPKTGYLNAVLKRCMNASFKLSSTAEPLSEHHLAACYLDHQHSVFKYFAGRTDFLTIDISQSGSLEKLLQFLEIRVESAGDFPHLNAGKQVDGWQQLKHANKINSLSAGKEHRKFFDYQ